MCHPCCAESQRMCLNCLDCVLLTLCLLPKFLHCKHCINKLLFFSETFTFYLFLIFPEIYMCKIVGICILGWMCFRFKSIHSWMCGIIISNQCMAAVSLFLVCLLLRHTLTFSLSSLVLPYIFMPLSNWVVIFHNTSIEDWYNCHKLTPVCVHWIAGWL